MDINQNSLSKKNLDLLSLCMLCKRIYSFYMPAAKSVHLSLNCFQNHAVFFFFPHIKYCNPSKYGFHDFKDHKLFLTASSMYAV